MTQSPIEPSRRDKLKPLELVGFSAVLGVFAGLVVLMATREILLSVIFLGVGFIVALVTLAMLSMSMKENDEPDWNTEDWTPKAPDTTH
ncbi:ABC transporter ATP-binding protein [Lysinibacter cavernae]|uniref:UDP-N-acetylmuramyl pentapeptide phosphotransferase/UDP-N-acetylglucosamine-1-phosphate transferase n=1 Tax=Lysinibacter cavernae TaxID=1640652 RepID=A0A7X5R2S5_9MICO|nr:ABC transporter ATP-binding protein [Lysinibacter cavernae]NIH54613.1 UDP-N-acetylmuramyl pentapeptide phosphotransferase/UDP-N-acetylglucosamine-1-phosphate transferase [Lysinibacter cavernae]